MISKNKVDLSDFNYEEDDEHSPMWSLAKKAKSVPGRSAKKGELSLPSVPVDSRADAEPLPPITNAFKVAPKLDQSSIKVESKVAPKLDQSSIKAKLTSSSSDIKVAPEPTPNHASKLDQSSIKVASTVSIETLTGLQRNSLIFIYESCRIFGSKISPPIQIRNLADSIKTTVAAARIAVQRIEQKGFVRRFEYKDGRGGWTKYELPDEIYQQLFFKESSIKVASKLDQSSIKVAPEPTPEPTPSLSSSSRDLNFKESTTTQGVDNFSSIDVGLVQQFGITASVLARCIELYPSLQLEQLESLVIRFSEFMKDPKNKVQSARGFFISLAEQTSKGQVPLDHIETPDERLMRLFIERQKEAKAQKVDVERAAQEFECEAWMETLTLEMQLTLVPETAFLRAGTVAHVAMLRKHFADNIWPSRRIQILATEPAAVEATL